MARYVHQESGTEFTTGMLVFTFIFLMIVGWIGAGAIAAIPAFFGSVTAAMWVWGVLGGIWTGLMVLGVQEYKSQARRLS